METTAPGAAPAPPSRSELLDGILARLSGRGARVTLLSAPRGWGKREILERAVQRLEPAGIHPIEIDLARSAVHPGEFACAVAAACLETTLGAASPAVAGMTGAPPPEARLRGLAGSGAMERLGRAGAAARSILEGLESRGSRSAPMIASALALPRILSQEAGGPVALIIHALDHLPRLAPYPGLRRIDNLLAEALEPDTVRVAASVSPEGRPDSLVRALSGRLGAQLAVEELPPLGPAESQALGAGDQALLKVTGGRLLTTRLLAAALAEGGGLEGALARAFDPVDGRLFHELRFDYHLLIERTRGHAACRAVLNVLAREEGLDLSGVSARLRRTPGSTLDYLRWLGEVGLVSREGRRYRFRDPLLRLYVLLFQVPEGPRDARERAAVVRRFLAGLESPPVPLRPVGRPRGRRSGRAAADRPARPSAAPERAAPGDDLMEID